MKEITDMTLSHLDAVYEIEKNSFSIPWSKNMIRKEITDNKHAIYKVALYENKIVGYAGMWHVVNEGQITNIAVDQAFRRIGIGALLVEALVAEAQEKEMIGLTLEVRVSNKAAQKLYFKYGFKAEGLRKRYYADTGEDAVIMWRYFKIDGTQVESTQIFF